MSVRRSLGFTARQAASKSKLGGACCSDVVLLHDDHVLDPVQRPHAVRESLFGDDDARLGIIHLVLDLLRRVGVVERERRSTEVHRRRIEPVKLRSVREHDCHRAARLEAQSREPAGDAAHLVGVFAPAHRELVVLGAQCAAVRDAPAAVAWKASATVAAAMPGRPSSALLGGYRHVRQSTLAG